MILNVLFFVLFSHLISSLSNPSTHLKMAKDPSLLRHSLRSPAVQINQQNRIPTQMSNKQFHFKSWFSSKNKKKNIQSPPILPKSDQLSKKPSDFKSWFLDMDKKNNFEPPTLFYHRKAKEAAQRGDIEAMKVNTAQLYRLQHIKQNVASALNWDKLQRLNHQQLVDIFNALESPPRKVEEPEGKYVQVEEQEWS